MSFASVANFESQLTSDAGSRSEDRREEPEEREAQPDSIDDIEIEEELPEGEDGEETEAAAEPAAEEAPAETPAAPPPAAQEPAWVQALVQQVQSQQQVIQQLAQQQMQAAQFQQMQAYQQQAHQSEEQRAQAMLQADMNPEDPRDVFLFNTYQQQQALAQQYQQMQQMFSGLQQQAQQLQIEQAADATLTRALEKYEVPAETRAWILQSVMGSVRNGTPIEDAVRATMGPISPLLKGAAKNTPRQTLPKPNQAGMRAVAASGKGSGHTQSKPRTVGDLRTKLQAFEGGKRR